MKFLSGLANRLRVGKHVYVVGGAVRNFVIEQPIKDIDVMIDALGAGHDSEWFAKQVAKAIPTKTSLTTNQYGVAILTVAGDWELDEELMKGEVIEIANARKESYGGEAGKGYKPSDVEFATVEEDILRREFTFNTLLWRLSDLASGPEKAEIIDLTGCGMKDLEEGFLRCPSDPDKTFTDDPTRMLRAIKFVAKYGFKIPPDVAASIKKNAKKMKQAPWEAIGTLFVENVLKEATASEALKLMKKLGLLDVVADMVQENKRFSSYLVHHLKKNPKVGLLFEMMDLGLPVGAAIGFLDRKQQDRLREITAPWPDDKAAEFLAFLKKPIIDNEAIIERFDLQGRERGSIRPVTQEVLLETPELAWNKRKLQQAVEKAMTRQKRGSAEDGFKTGDRTGVGLFIPLPPGLAQQFPALGDDDKSPPHVTFLYIGEVPEEREEDFLQVIQDSLNSNHAPVQGPIRGEFQALDYFEHPTEEGVDRVAIAPVRFNEGMEELRWYLRDQLISNGFDVDDSFPLVYNPHTTLAYMRGQDAQYTDEVPTGSWDFDSIEVWGLPEVYEANIGRTIAYRVASRWMENQTS